MLALALIAYRAFCMSIGRDFLPAQARTGGGRGGPQAEQETAQARAAGSGGGASVSCAGCCGHGGRLLAYTHGGAIFVDVN